LTNPDWKDFEIAIAAFAKALDTNAAVTHDVRLPDIHTNTPRQRDVWIEAKVCQHFPIKALVSCKRTSRKLDQQDIDAFNGERISSGAHLGVIYSYSGFTDNAIAKAKILSISCCRLYINEPSNIPNSIIILGSFCCTPRLSLSVISPLDPTWQLQRWSDLFALEFQDSGGNSIAAIDAIVQSYFKGENDAKKNIMANTLFPTAWIKQLELLEETKDRRTLKVLIRGLWNIYEGQLEAHLLNGSYNFTSEEFIGSVKGPVIDLHSMHPGPAWKLLDHTPKLQPAAINSVCILSGGNAKEALIKDLGPKQITIEDCEWNKLASE